MAKVIVLFSHAVLFRAWKKAELLLANEGVALRVISQTAAMDWVRFVDEELAQADAVYLDITRHFPSFEPLAQAARKAAAAAVVVPGGMETTAALGNENPQATETVGRYLKAGTPSDLANAVRFLLCLSGKVPEAPPPPTTPVLCGIHAPGREQPFSSLAELLAWKFPSLPTPGPYPMVAYCFERTSWLDGETALPDAMAREAEAEGLLLLPIFCDWELAARITSPDHPLSKLLSDCGERLVAIWNGLFSHIAGGMGRESVFAPYDVPVFQVVRSFSQTPEQWQASDEGLSPMTVSFSVIQPEMLGCIEPTLVAGNRREAIEGNPEPANKAVPIPERIRHLARRSMAWHRLRHVPNAEKRLAIVLHNAPCKGVESTIASAAGLDALESTARLLQRLAQEGYQVDGAPKSGEELLRLLLDKKAIQEFRWTNVAEIASKGGVLAYVDSAAYARNFQALPAELQTEIDQAWDPFPGKAMVGHDSQGNAALLVTGLRFGHVMVMLEPKRGCYGPKCDGEVCRILHEPAIAPTHHWLATYWFIQQQADAVIHMGANGPLEYLPGKRLGLSERCYGEISLGTLPNLYPYIMSSTGEGLIAKRRARAVLIDHLSAPLQRSPERAAQLAEVQELHRQHAQATSVAERGRQERLAAELRAWGCRVGLLADDAGEAEFSRFLRELDRRVRQMQRQLVDGRNHVLGRIPDDEAAACYLAEARGPGNRPVEEGEVRAALRRTADEIDHLVRALNGHFVPPGPSGQLSRGQVQALPTGRNFFGTDLNAIPTHAAWEMGVQMGTLLLQRYLAEEDKFPETVGVTLWSSDVFQAEGELVSQVLWLLGCRPIWANGGRVRGVEPMPTSELRVPRTEGGEAIARPRIDVVVQMSGVVRDTLPNMYMLIDEAVSLVGRLQEPPSQNYVRAHMQARMGALRQEMAGAEESVLSRLASLRVFSSKPGSYGTGVSYSVDASAWESDKDLAEAFVNWTGYAYGASSARGNVPPPTGPTLKEYARLMGAVDIAYQKALGPEYDALSLGCYASFQGGMAVTRRAVSGRETKLYWGDSVSDARPELRDFREELEISLAGRLLSEAWIDQRKADGYQGASAIACRVNTLFTWSALTHQVTKAHFDAVHRTFIENEENRRWLAEANLYALEEITRRLLEAQSRGLWQADEKRLEMLKEVVLQIEGDMEGRIGVVEGEMQGGGVNIKTRKDVDRWKYDFTL